MGMTTTGMTTTGTPAGRDANGRFARGNAGRPLGSRNRVSKRVARAILRDFESNQAELLPRLRRWFLPQYLTLVGRLLPRAAEEGGPELDALDEVETAKLIAEARAALARIDAGEGSLAELEAAILGEGGEGDGHNSGAVVIGA
jgi:hypothetical protein